MVKENGCEGKRRERMTDKERRGEEEGGERGRCWEMRFDVGDKEEMKCNVIQNQDTDISDSGTRAIGVMRRDPGRK